MFSCGNIKLEQKLCMNPAPAEAAEVAAPVPAAEVAAAIADKIKISTMGCYMLCRKRALSNSKPSFCVKGRMV